MRGAPMHSCTCSIHGCKPPDRFPGLYFHQSDGIVVAQSATILHDTWYYGVWNSLSLCSSRFSHAAFFKNWCPGYVQQRPGALLRITRNSASAGRTTCPITEPGAGAAGDSGLASSASASPTSAWVHWAFFSAPPFHCSGIGFTSKLVVIIRTLKLQVHRVERANTSLLELAPGTPRGD